jgi:TPR repeat protein
LHYGFCLSAGRGIPIDIVLSASYYQQADDHSFPIAEGLNDFSLEFGLGINADIAIALKVSEEASVHDDSSGMNACSLSGFWKGY